MGIAWPLSVFVVDHCLWRSLFALVALRCRRGFSTSGGARDRRRVRVVAAAAAALQVDRKGLDHSRIPEEAAARSSEQARLRRGRSGWELLCVLAADSKGQRSLTWFRCFGAAIVE